MPVVTALGQPGQLTTRPEPLPWELQLPASATSLAPQFALPSAMYSTPATLLPALQVRPLRLRTLLPSEVVSASGGEDFELQRHPGLNLPILPALNLRIADELFFEHQLRASQADLDATARAIDRGGDAPEAAAIRAAVSDSEAQATSWRSDGVWNGGFSPGLIRFRE